MNTQVNSREEKNIMKMGEEVFRGTLFLYTIERIELFVDAMLFGKHYESKQFNQRQVEA